MNELTPDQHRQLRSQYDAKLVNRFRASSIAGVVIALILAVVLAETYPMAPWSARVGAPVAAALACLLGVAVTWLPMTARHVGPVSIILIGLPLVACIAFCAAHTGGFSSPIAFSIFIIWAAGAVVFPLTTRLYAAGVAAQLLLLAGIIEWTSPAPGSLLLFLVVTLGMAGMCILGSSLRESAEVQLFLAQEALEQLNRQLEQRVATQVGEIVTRAREVEVLNVQLQAKVRERSRELAQALTRLSRGDDRLPAPGDEVGGRVKLVRLLGHGGMGAVYLADDLLTGQQVAVKLMRPGAFDPALLQRFVGEAAAAAAVRHPGIVKPLHVDVTAEGLLYHVMEYVNGVTLAQLFDGQMLAAGDAARLGSEVADALAAAHEAGVIHRDIKPANLIGCRQDPAVRILDFGLSKIRERGASDAGLTRAHQIIGTPRYMSPEQVEGPATVSPASDVYSLGLVIYELACGRSPFNARTTAEYCRAHVMDEPLPLRGARADAVAPLSALVMACLEKRPAKRPTSAALAKHLSGLAESAAAASAAEIISRATEIVSQAGESVSETRALAPTETPR